MGEMIGSGKLDIRFGNSPLDWDETKAPFTRDLEKVGGGSSWAAQLGAG